MSSDHNESTKVQSKCQCSLLYMFVFVCAAVILRHV